MNHQTRNRESGASGLWIGVGLATGIAVGFAVGDTTFGVAIGLIGGGAVTLAIEQRQKKRGPMLLITTVVALVGVVVLRIVESA